MRERLLVVDLDHTLVYCDPYIYLLPEVETKSLRAFFRNQGRVYLNNSIVQLVRTTHDDVVVYTDSTLDTALVRVQALFENTPHVKFLVTADSVFNLMDSQVVAQRGPKLKKKSLIELEQLLNPHLGNYRRVIFYDDRPKSYIRHNPERHTIISISPFVVERSRQLSLETIASKLGVVLTEKLRTACEVYREEEYKRLADERVKKLNVLIK